MNKERMLKIKEEIKELIEEALDIVKFEGSPHTYQQAKAYWYPQILMVLDKEHDYLGGSMCTMEDTIKEIWGNQEEEAHPHKRTKHQKRLKIQQKK